MRKTRIFALVLVFVMLLIPLSACHGKLVPESGKEVLDHSIEIPETFDTTRNYEIVFWAKNDTNKTQVAIYDKAVEDFQKLYPNITVKIRYYTDYKRIYSDVITNIATDTTPNVCITYPDHIATYISGEKTVVDLDNLIADKKYGLGGSELRFDSPRAEEVIPQFMSEGIIEGHYFALPFMRSTEACYINKTYVEKLGFTLPETLSWDFVWQVCEAATEKNADGTYKVNGQSIMMPFIYKSTDNMMIQMLRQLGADYATEDGEIQIFNKTTMGIMEELGARMEAGQFYTFADVSYPANYLNAGQCIFAIDSTAGATWMGSEAPLTDIPRDQYVDFETAVMVIPQYDVTNPQMISQGPSICIFDKDDKQEVLASWIFAQFMLTNEVQISYSETEGYVPVTSKAQNSAEYQDYLAREGEDEDHYDIKIKASKLLLDNTQNTFVTVVYNGSAALRAAAGDLIEDTRRAVQAKQKITEARIKAIFKSVTDNNHLVVTEEESLPKEAVILLTTLGTVWLILGTLYIIRLLKRKKKNRD